MMGEKVGAVIVPRPGIELDAAEIRAFALERIADFKAPQFIAFRAEPLPRNAGGKVLSRPAQGDRRRSRGATRVGVRRCAEAASVVEVVELGAGARPVGLEQPAGGRDRDVGRRQVVDRRSRCWS